MSDQIVPDDKDWTWVLERICPECGFDAGSLDVRHVGDAVRANAEAWGEVLGGDDATVRTRSAPDRWSTLEYGAHVRDVYALFLRRLTMMLDTGNPMPSPTRSTASTATSWHVRDGARTGRRSPSTPSPGTCSTIPFTTSGIAGSLRRIVRNDLQSAP